MTDPLTAAICADLQRRAAKGEAEYGTTVHEARLTRKEWLTHAYEESLDLAVYLRKLMEMESAERPPITTVEAAALQALLAWMDGWDRLLAGNPSGASHVYELQQHLRLMAAAVRKERTP